MGFAAAALAVTSMGTSIYQAEESKKAAKKGLRETERANRQAESAALQQQRETAEELARAKRRRPEVPGQPSAAGTPGSTLLTGAKGVDPTLLNLGRENLLGL